MNSKLIRVFFKFLLVAVFFYLFFILYKTSTWKSDDEWKVMESFSVKIYVPPLSDEILDIHRRLNLTNPGHLGFPVIMPDRIPEDIQAEIDKSNEEFKFNEFLSRIIPLDRELLELRTVECQEKVYSNDLPKVSVILAFYNEPFSMVMRTIYSILKRSPLDLIEEILLVDDYSDNGSWNLKT